MTLYLNYRKLLPLLPFIIPLLCIIVAKSSLFSENPAQLSLAITFDLLLTTPVIYFLIIRKAPAIPNTTIVPVFFIGIVIASFILPEEHQYYLAIAKKWILPLIELSVVAYVVYTIRKGFKAIKKNRSSQVDFFNAAKKATGDILPKKLVIPFATELSVFYYGFLSWKKRTYKKNEFTYHKNTSTSLTLFVFVFLIILEAGAVHLALQGWNPVTAWVLTILSVYGIFQLVGIARSFAKRPIVIMNQQVLLRYGIMNEVDIPFKKIQAITSFTKSVEKNEGYIHLSPFKDMEGNNILIELNEEMKLNGFYGFKKPFNKLLIHLDKPEDFIDLLKENLSHLSYPITN